MHEHVIYYFSGTGNSLRSATIIQKALGNCAVVSMGTSPVSPGQVASIGFVFPCYFGGVPQRVLDYVAEMDFSGQESTYVYAVVTYGALLGSALWQLDRSLQERGITLSYAAPLKSFANYVAMYDMSDKVSEKIAQSKEELQHILVDILEQKPLRAKKASPLMSAYNRLLRSDVRTKDSNFVVQESCNGCGICEQVCSVNNVKLEEGRPCWLGHCEQCMACIQWCPKKAIDYGNKTQRRGRYTNPEITVKMFIDHLSGVHPNNPEGQ